jgi:hypothetical protein
VIKEDRPGETRYYVELTLKNGAITIDKKKQTTGAEKQKLFPTDIGMIVTDFLVEYFQDILDYNWYGSGTKTQITFTFDLKAGDRVRCRIDRGA